jgi:hypothetical protein
MHELGIFAHWLFEARPNSPRPGSSALEAFSEMEVFLVAFDYDRDEEKEFKENEDWRRRKKENRSRGRDFTEQSVCR